MKLPRRQWEVWALFDNPVFVRRFWTKTAAYNHAWTMHYFTDWLRYEVRRAQR